MHAYRGRTTVRILTSGKETVTDSLKGKKTEKLAVVVSLRFRLATLGGAKNPSK